jgi:transposase
VPQEEVVFTKKGRAELLSLRLAPWASRRREELLRLLDQLEAPITELDRAVLEQAQRRADVVLLMTHPGIGPVTALAFVLAIGPITRFAGSKKLASYLGLIPSEESSGGRRRLGAISKQGNTMVRWLLIEAVYPAVRKDPALRQDYQRLKFRRGHAVAKVAIARKLAVRMYWMLRSGADYARLVRRQGSPGATLVDPSSSLG